MPDDPRSSPPAPDPVPDDRGPDDSDSAASESERHSPWRTVLGVAAAVVLAVVIVVLGIVNPKPSTGITTDRLGPAQGERVEDYLADARASLTGGDSDQHWALVSFTDYLTPDRIPTAAGGLRISGVIQHVPIDRVQTPVITVATPASVETARNSADAAAGLLLAQQFRDPRSAEIARVTAARLRANCACTAGIVVRGTLPQLRDLAATPGVRAVQALPADAIAGRFAVAPLLPAATGVVAPTPDDGPVPAE
ncbi:hypothetical protein ACIA5E_31590 [Nocardia asteroides]|uniref:hypothetical protein n=1 Tax=Nocardia asteroides TaxID=1824 RepID=UPI0037B7FFBD